MTTGVPRATLEAVHEPGSVFTALLAGHVMVGGVLSTKLMCWVQTITCPANKAETSLHLPSLAGLSFVDIEPAAGLAFDGKGPVRRGVAFAPPPPRRAAS